MVVRPELDRLPAVEVVDYLLAAEAAVVPAVRAAAAEIAAAAELIAKRYGKGGRLIFVGAGTSGRIAQAEAAELPGTFGLPPERVLACLAGAADGSAGTDWDEDDLSAAEVDLTAVALRATDTLVAVAASGNTPYTLLFAERARAIDAAVIAVVNVNGSGLGALADVVVVLATGPEALRESSRLTAGTAQKIALNALTTAAMARLGRVHGDLMIDVAPANLKLQRRVVGIVAEITGCGEAEARGALTECDFNARAAVLRLALRLDPAQAIDRATAHRTLRAALEAK